jgi:hypothetical protein
VGIDEPGQKQCLKKEMENIIMRGTFAMKPRTFKSKAAASQPSTESWGSSASAASTSFTNASISSSVSSSSISGSISPAAVSDGGGTIGTST